MLSDITNAWATLTLIIRTRLTTENWQGQERRKHLRYPCFGEVAVGNRGSDVSLTGQLSDISLGGCYIDMMNPLPPDTEVEVALRVANHQFKAIGLVRASRHGFGMGVAFTEITDESRSALKELVDWLAGSLPQPVEQKVGGAPFVRSDRAKTLSNLPYGNDRNVVEALQALVQLLERRGLLSAHERAEIDKTMHGQRALNSERFPNSQNLGDEAPPSSRENP